MNFGKMVKLTKNFAKEHKSEIATGIGIIAEAACVGLTINATCKAKDEAAGTKKTIEELWARVEAMEVSPEREEAQKEAEKEEKKLIRACGRKIARYYVWTAATFALSIGCYIFSVKNGRKEIRNLSAALAAEVAARKAEKKRAKNLLSEDQYNELYYGIKKSGKTIEDENGNEFETYEYCVPSDNNFDNVVGTQKVAVSPQAFIFDKNCCEWTPSWAYCKTWILKVWDWANGEVLKEGYVGMNAIRMKFGRPALDECVNLGVVFDPEKGVEQVRFEIFEMDPPGNPYNNPIYLIDVNYEDIHGKINDAIRALNE